MSAVNETPDLVLAKQLIDHTKTRGFQFQRIAEVRTGHYWAPERQATGSTRFSSTGSVEGAMRRANAGHLWWCRVVQ